MCSIRYHVQLNPPAVRFHGPVLHREMKNPAPAFFFWAHSSVRDPRFLPLPINVPRGLPCPQLLEQYAEQVPWQSEIRHDAIRFPPMAKMIVDYQVSGAKRKTDVCCNPSLFLSVWYGTPLKCLSFVSRRITMKVSFD